MEVILLQDVEKLGLRGDVVDVARGYARNYLLPRRLAETATPARVAEMQRVDAQRAKHEARTAEQAQEIGELLGKTVLRFEVKAGPTGSLFGSVTPSDIADEIWRARKVRVDRRKIATDPLKRIGRYSDSDRALPGRDRRGEDARRSRGWRASARGRARGTGGSRGRGGCGGRRGGGGRARGSSVCDRRGAHGGGIR